MLDRDKERFSHKSFGQISFSRRQISGEARFYGSELPQAHYITMVISNSEINRDLTCDRYHATKKLVEVRLTSNQFSELITSMNIGDGVPCTIEMLPNERIEQLPSIESRKDFVHRQFEERMKEFAKTLREKQNRVKELSAKKTLSKEDQRELNFTVEWLTQEVASNIPYFAKCFQETTDKVVLEAKSEVENAILHKVTTLGLGELHKQNKLLSESDNTK